MPTKGRQAAQKKYNAKPEQKKRRAARNTARRRMIASGRAKKGDGKDVDHKDGNPRNNSKSNLRMRSKSKNRSLKRDSKARKRRQNGR
tara:strand:+ start:425 stop:688 length:264 start_codon:yes stop_codon:yes gene_type:complete